MTSRLNPYIAFPGTAREAMEFYKSVFGGELTINTFGDMPAHGDGPAPDPNGVMHATLQTSSGFFLMASDVPPGMPHTPGDNISVSLSGDAADELRGYWEKLSGSGKVVMPLEMQMWGDEFGMCTDQFGITWMVNIAGPDNRG